MSKRRVTGYTMRAEIQRAKNANKAAREVVGRLIDGHAKTQVEAVLLAKLAAALGENLDATMEIEKIIFDGAGES